MQWNCLRPISTGHKTSWQRQRWMMRVKGYEKTHNETAFKSRTKDSRGFWPGKIAKANNNRHWLMQDYPGSCSARTIIMNGIETIALGGRLNAFWIAPVVKTQIDETITSYITARAVWRHQSIVWRETCTARQPIVCCSTASASLNHCWPIPARPRWYRHAMT